VQAEQQEHGDILMLDTIDSNTPDPPPNDGETATALKVVYGVKWAVDNYEFLWFVRLGDDAYFRVDYFLLSAAIKLEKEKLLLGSPGACVSAMLHSSFAAQAWSVVQPQAAVAVTAAQ
jgi:hypothetical protein